MTGQPRPPIGLELARAAKGVSKAFDDALATAGGTVPVWTVLISLMSQRFPNQRELAAAVGIQEATLTHHLNAMAAQGLLTRDRDPENRRTHQVLLTDEGRAAFFRMRNAAVAFDRRLRGDLSEEEVSSLERLLGRLVDNVRG